MLFICIFSQTLLKLKIAGKEYQVMVDKEVLALVTSPGKAAPALTIVHNLT